LEKILLNKISELKLPELKDNPLAIKEWKRLKPLLEELGCSQIDKGILLAYLFSFALLMKAQAELQTGQMVSIINGIPRETPWHKIHSTQANNVFRFAGQLGFSPTSRKKLKLDIEDDDQEVIS
jgi:P27 family predicted phage terminase small subunit